MKKPQVSNHHQSFHKGHAKAQQHQGMGKNSARAEMAEPGEGTPNEERQDRLKGETDTKTNYRGLKK